MKKKLFLHFLWVGLLSACLCCGCLVAVMAQQSAHQTFHRLAAEAELTRQGYAVGGSPWLESLETDLRLTQIAPDGSVLYDNEADAAGMVNHLNRSEIEQALASGQGQSIHQSETLMQRTFYYALRMDDGTVLRVACTENSALSALMSSLPLIAATIMMLTLLCVALAARLSSQLVRPINAVHLDEPRMGEVYPELSPLVERIRQQNRTIREQMEQLQQSQHEFSALTGNMSEGFLLISTGMEVLSGNHAAYRLLQMNEEEHQQLRKACHVPRIVTAAESALAGVKDEAILQFGATSWQMIASPVSSDGRLYGAAILLLDVTERERREALRREFSANVSHELKTPLTSISGYAELLKEGMLPPEKTGDAAAAIYRESQRMIALIGDIIKLSRLDEADGSVEQEAVDLYQLAGEVLESLRMVAQERQIRLELRGTSQTVIGIPHVLREMLYNLCDNAIKYNRDGGSVTVSVTAAQCHIRVTVEDTGIGIPYEEQQRVFERFYRVDKSRSRAMGGTGLGLSIVKHGAQLHRATLDLTSEPDKGTTVALVF
ncbi:MAG: ATP-binding protein [bacterium]|nr:ATP-binding protein [bacterium]